MTLSPVNPDTGSRLCDPPPVGGPYCQAPSKTQPGSTSMLASYQVEITASKLPSTAPRSAAPTSEMKLAARLWAVLGSSLVTPSCDSSSTAAFNNTRPLNAPTPPSTPETVIVYVSVSTIGSVCSSNVWPAAAALSEPTRAPAESRISKAARSPPRGSINTVTDCPASMANSNVSTAPTESMLRSAAVS